MVVERGDLVDTLWLTGELRARDAVGIVVPDARIRPMQIRWMIEDGSPVAAGDLLVEFDNSTLLNNLVEAEIEILQQRYSLSELRAQGSAGVERLEFELLEARSQLEKAQLEAEVPQDLTPPKVFQEKQRDLNKARLAVWEAEQALEAEIAASRAEVEIQQLQLEGAVLDYQRAEDGIQRLSVRSPRDGLFVVEDNPQEDRPYQVGDNVWPSMPLARIPDLATLEVHAALFDVDDGRLEEGMESFITLDALPDLELRGRILSVGRMAMAQSQSSLRRAFDVVVSMEVGDDFPSGALQPGMSARVAVLRPVAEEVLLVPRAAISFSAATRSSESQLEAQLEAQSEAQSEAQPVTQGETPRRAEAWLPGARRVPVELGACNAHRCAVLSGLSLDQEVMPAREEGSGA
ncbi:MAG: HlyD family efflux transporter periplasmic adaptor subunit [Acidobacteriota bacterium]